LPTMRFRPHPAEHWGEHRVKTTDDPRDTVAFVCRYDEVLDARRCAIDKCGSGFGVPCLAAAGSFRWPTGSAGARERKQGDGLPVAKVVVAGGARNRESIGVNWLRCVHCAGEWEVECDFVEGS
jgi:hypothetical protein